MGWENNRKWGLKIKRSLWEYGFCHWKLGFDDYGHLKVLWIQVMQVCMTFKLIAVNNGRVKKLFLKDGN